MQVLVVGQFNGPLSLACRMAIKRGAKVLNANSVSIAVDSLRSGKGIDLVIMDVNMDVASLIKQIELSRISVPVVGCGTNENSERAIAAIKAGAQEFIPLPPDEEMIASIFQAISEERHKILVYDPKMKSVIKLVERVADSNASIMITGSSGTGKEMVARHLHLKSKRCEYPFVAVNCSAIPETLLESELFGYERGAFTGAIARRIGRFEEANKGTLLLDEISEMDPRLQSKLLRVLQEKEIDRLGGSKTIPIDVRILATSNRNMAKAVKEGSFREDLYFRLNVINIQVPDLKDRPLDIKGLAEKFIQQYSNENQKPVPKVNEDVWKIFETYTWPGNVRELENAIHRAILVCNDIEINTDDIVLTSQDEDITEINGNSTAEELQAKIISGNIGRTVAEVEKELIINTLGRCLGNKSATARVLGISVRTLRNKLQIYKNIETPIAQNS